MKKTVILSIMALVALSCQKSPMSDTHDDSEIRFNVGIETKATATAFENGDAISLWATEYDGDTPLPLQIGGNYLNNEKIVLNGTNWNGARPVYWSTKPCDFYAIYPYIKEVTSIESQPFSVATDQNSLMEDSSIDGYEASDLMYASTKNISRTDGAVNLVFHHMLSRCKVEIVKGENFEGEIPDDIVVHIYNTETSAKFDLSNGSLRKDSSGGKKTITMRKIDNLNFEAIVLPQNIEVSTPLVEVTMGGIAYLLKYSLSFKPGYTHTIALTLNSSPDQEMIEIAIDADIDDWD